MTRTPNEGHVVKAPTRAIETDFPNLNTTTTAKSIIVHHPEDPEPAQRMAIIEASGVLDFWSDSEEDVYSSDEADDV